MIAFATKNSCKPLLIQKKISGQLALIAESMSTMYFVQMEIASRSIPIQFGQNYKFFNLFFCSVYLFAERIVIISLHNLSLKERKTNQTNHRRTKKPVMRRVHLYAIRLIHLYAVCTEGATLWIHFSLQISYVNFKFYRIL